MQEDSSDPSAWHLREVDDLAREHGVDLRHGLTEADVERRTGLHGPNELPDASRRSAWRILLEQFSDFMILVLVGAAVVSGIVGDLLDTAAIIVILLLNALVGFVQAWRADRALAALKELSASHATVLRAGQVGRVPARALVPGDVVLLEAGNQVPADLRLTHAANLLVDESALTGESVAVEKHARAMESGGEALGDRLNMAYKGTTAARGRGQGLVVATGPASQLGRIAGMLTSAEDRATPLQRRLAEFGRRVAVAVIGICAVIFLVGLLRGEPPVLMLLTALSLAVAAIPEALPAVVTVLLALGARRMVAQKALVRRLPSVETLGSVTFICSDKTGTLTQNRMRVEEVVPGAGGEVNEQVAAELLRAAALCNDAFRDASGQWQGDPTEIALVEAAADAGVMKDALALRHPRVQELAFDSGRKRMTTFHRADAGFVAYTKGAPESVLPLCSAMWSASGPRPLDGQHVLATAERMAQRGLRVLALARRDHGRVPAGSSVDTVETQMELLGLVGMIDPPRPEAAAAVRDAVAAGVTPVMITGDHPATAVAIARKLGIVPAQATGHGEHVVLTGAQLARLDDAALRERVLETRVYARVDPAQKIRIVEALQWHGEFVAMTGDGVNDAPALKRADIGVAMGRGGTDVAREASSLVLLDDNFSTIVAAVREGRRIYDNVRKFVRYAMTGNSGEIWTIFLAPLVGLPVALLPIHILWVNLVTDGLPGLALAAEPAEGDVMRRPPRRPDESLFAHGMWQHILLVGLLIGGLCLGVQAWATLAVPSQAQTMVFTVLTFAQMAHVLAVRSERESLFGLGILSNKPLLGAVALTCALQLATIYVPWMQPLFRTVPLAWREMAICIAAASVVLFAVEVEKAWRRRML